jgi:hypothetical protein
MIGPGGSVVTNPPGSSLDEELAWNPFLNNFGLGFDYPAGYNNLNGNLPITSNNALFSGVATLHVLWGNDVTLTGSNPPASILVTYSGHNLFGMYSSLPGDANLDRTVNGADLNIVLSNYNQTGMIWTQGDFNSDRMVNGADLNIVLSNYNQSVGVGAAVPEPSALVLIVIGTIGLLAYAWRRRGRAHCLSCAAVVAATLIAGSARANVFNMGGARNPTTGTWTGLASLEIVPVGNPGNALDKRYSPTGIGAVDTSYAIGKYEVTAAQYTEFLNAVAKTDTYGLYDEHMDYDSGPPVGGFPTNWGCNIKRSGNPGNYTYEVAADWANRPVNWVSFWDAARFINWLQNGQPTGVQGSSTTEDGAYTLNGFDGNDGSSITRNSGARWWLPGANEWYKAAFHKNDGVTGNYWNYAAATNAVPSNALSTPDPGNNANFRISVGYDEFYTIGGPYWRTPAGEFENSKSP